jgi:putative FmdB family regulatory protein
MPTYRYKCNGCNEYFEYLLPIDQSDAVYVCPNSCGNNLKKVFTAPTIVFKGSGFYSTDKSKGTKSAKTEKAKPEHTPTPVKSEGNSGKNEAAYVRLQCYS